jgi:hypothetical protein
MTQAAHGWIPLPPSLAALLLVLGGLLEVFGPICNPDRLLPAARRRCVHILRDRYRGSVPQFLELPVQWGMIGHQNFLALPQEFRFGRVVFSTSPPTPGCSRCAAPSH